MISCKVSYKVFQTIWYTMDILGRGEVSEPL